MQSICMALYGLRGMQSYHPEVLQIISALVPKIHACRESMNSQSVAMAVVSLYNMDCNHPEQLRLVAALTPKIRSCQEELKPEEIEMVQMGILGLNLGRPEVSELFRVLATKFKLPLDALKVDKSGQPNLFEYLRLVNPKIKGLNVLEDLEPYRYENLTSIKMSDELKEEDETIDWR